MSNQVARSRKADKVVSSLPAAAAKAQAVVAAPESRARTAAL